MKERLKQLQQKIGHALCDHDEYFVNFTDFLALMIYLPENLNFSLGLIFLHDTINLRFDGLKKEITEALITYEGGLEALPWGGPSNETDQER